MYQHIATNHQIKSRQTHMQMFWNQNKQIITLLATIEYQRTFVSWPLHMHDAHMQYIHVHVVAMCVCTRTYTQMYTCTHVYVHSHITTQIAYNIIIM